MFVGSRVLDEDALPATTTTCIVTAAVVDVGAQHAGKGIGSSTQHPNLFTVHTSTKGSGVHWGILRWRNILLQGPWPQLRRVTGLATAVPIVSGTQSMLPACVWGLLACVPPRAVRHNLSAKPTRRCECHAKSLTEVLHDALMAFALATAEMDAVTRIISTVGVLFINEFT